MDGKYSEKCIGEGGGGGGGEEEAAYCGWNGDLPVISGIFNFRAYTGNYPS